MTTITLPPGVLSTHREQLAAWLEANGIDSRQVPLTHPIRVEEGEGEGHGVVHYRVFALTPDGRRQLDGKHVVRSEPRAAPCTVPLPTLPPPLAAPHGDRHAPAPRPGPAKAT